MNELQKEIATLFVPGTPPAAIVAQITGNPATDKIIRAKCPAPKKRGAVLMRHTFWHTFRHHIWPRVFSGDPARQQTAIEYIQRQRRAYEKADKIFPPRPIFQNL